MLSSPFHVSLHLILFRIVMQWMEHSKHGKDSVILLMCWVTVGWSVHICIYTHGKCSFQFTCPECFWVVEENRKSSHQKEQDAV